jgi:hypothetical protein
MKSGHMTATEQGQLSKISAENPQFSQKCAACSGSIVFAAMARGSHCQPVGD